MTSLTDTEVQRGQKDPSINGLLSKLTRSPSRKQDKPFPPIPPLNADTPFLVQNNAPSTGSLSKRKYRPGFQRAATTPSAPVNLNPSRPDTSVGLEEPPKSASAANEPPAPFGSGPAGTASMPSNKPNPIAASVDITALFGPAGIPIAVQTAAPPAGVQNPNTVYQHIQDLSNKRIGTLDYMRKAHEGRIHWFNTLYFSKADVTRLPSYTPSRLARRATNYFLLGLSIPAILDVHQKPPPQSSTSSNIAVLQDFLKSFHNLLTEFEAFQQLHPPDGSNVSSLSRARIPQMFKRATQTSNKPRKSSGTAVSEIGLPMQQPGGPPTPGSRHHSSQPSLDTINTIGTFSTGTFSSTTSTVATTSPSTPLPTAMTFSPISSFPISSPTDTHANSTLLPHEGPYMYLLTPPLPFAPDFYCVFSTLCDVLIDSYQRLLQLISSPACCTPMVTELFTKVDARLRKVIVGGIVREFEGAAREGVRKELMGVQKVVLGGLMAT